MWLLRQDLFAGEKILVRTSVFLGLILRVIFLFLIYLLSGLNEQIHWPAIGVTLAYANDPSRAVAAFILPISGMINLTVIWLRMRRMRFLLHSPYHWASWLIIVSMMVVHTISLFGLGAITPLTNVALSYVVSAMWYGSTIQIILFVTLLNWQVSLIQPRYLLVYRLVILSLVLATSLAIALTIGWVVGPCAIVEIVLSSLTVLYALSYAHSSEFPLRSSCLFAYPASIPPVPRDVFEHAEILIKEVD
jgi:hypothetical protein